MAKSSRQKQKLLQILRMLMEKTDENHGLTVAQIIEELEDMGIPAERKSVYDDLEVLGQFLESMGYELCRVKTNTVSYYIGERPFQLAELKLLVDSVQSSKFITAKKSNELISKVEKLASVYEGRELQRQVYVSNRVKTPNETIYYAVDSIHKAISEDKKITFAYLEWVLGSGKDKICKRKKRDGKRYSVSPFSLTWDDENYYLVAFDSEAQAIRHYRVDKMEKVELSECKRDGKEVFKKFDMAVYSKSVFGMFGGELTEVRLRFSRDMIGVVADRFGKDIFVREESEESFVVDIKVALSPQFFGWVFGLSGKVQILSPDTAVEMYKLELAKVLGIYGEN